MTKEEFGGYTHIVKVNRVYDLIKLNIPYKVCEKIDLIAKKLNLNIIALSYVSRITGCVDILTNNYNVIISMNTLSKQLIFTVNTNNPRLKQISIMETENDIGAFYNKCEKTYKAIIYTEDFTKQVNSNDSRHLIPILQVALEQHLNYNMIIHSKGNWTIEVKTHEWSKEPQFVVHYNSESTGYSCSIAEVLDGYIKCDLRLTKEVNEKIYKYWNKIHK